MIHLRTQSPPQPELRLNRTRGMLPAVLCAATLFLPPVVYAQIPRAIANTTPTGSGGLLLSNTSFDFGPAIVGFAVTRTIAVVTNTGKAAAPLSTLLTGNAAYTLASDGCGATLPGRQSCNLRVTYAPQTASIPLKQKATLLLGSVLVKPYSFFDIALTGRSGALTPGVVTPTINSMVAQYTLTLPFAGTWNVAFGKTAAYGFTTGTVASPQPGTPTSILVAGMQANTVYHLRASVTLPNGVSVTDVDRTFTTGDVPPGIIPAMTVTTTPGLTPQPGIELINTSLGATLTAAYATDLAGNVIWTYSPPDRQYNSILYPVKPLANGHMLVMMSPPSQQTGPVDPNSVRVLREIDLAGNTVRELSIDTLNSRLQTAGFTGLHLEVFSHDMEQLPNGHILAVVNTFRPFTDLIGYPGVTNVLGDVVVDLDRDLQPVWVWNMFDHFDVNRHPMGLTDWGHTNAITYSPDDGNFLLSIRHQNWVVKVNYKDGQGDGGTLWKLGYQGDFALQNGTEPEDWFYAQHNQAFFSPNTTGVFKLGLMDNGNDRAFPDGTNCLYQAGRCYSTVPIFTVDEIARTARIDWRQTMPPALYSSFEGGANPLPNGDVEYDLGGILPGGPFPASQIVEVTPDAMPQTVWSMSIPTTGTYRAFRIPSLYPEVQW